MNETELRLRKIAERIKQIKPEDLVGKEGIISELEEKTKQIESLYERETLGGHIREYVDPYSANGQLINHIVVGYKGKCE